MTTRSPSLLSFASLAVLAVLAACSASPSTTERVCTDQDGQALRVCAPGATLKGIDVSTWQGTVTWPSVKNAGYVFAFARVSDGLNFPDAKFAPNWTGMKAAGIVRGAYQFFRPAQDPLAQANHFLLKLQQSGMIGAGDFAPVLDVEAVDGVALPLLRQRMQIWLDRMEQGTGRKPIIYTAAFMSSSIGTGFGAYPLWVANYGATCPSMPTGWGSWRLWQTSDTAQVPGIVGASVDLNQYNGTLSDLMTFTHAGIASDAGIATDASDAANAGNDGEAIKAGAGDTVNVGGGDDSDPTRHDGDPAGNAGQDFGSKMGDGRPAVDSALVTTPTCR